MRRGGASTAPTGPDGAGHAFLRPMLETPPATPDCTPRPAESVPRMTIQNGHATSTLASRSNAHIESLGGCSSGGLPLPRGLQPPPSRAIPYPEPRVGAAAAPFATSHNIPSMSSGRPAACYPLEKVHALGQLGQQHLGPAASSERQPQQQRAGRVGAACAPFATDLHRPGEAPPPRGSSVAVVRQAAARTRAREPSRAQYVKEMTEDLGGLPAPGGQWGWAGPQLHTQALWGGHAARAAPRAWNTWQPSARDGSLLLS